MEVMCHGEMKPNCQSVDEPKLSTSYFIYIFFFWQNCLLTNYLSCKNVCGTNTCGKDVYSKDAYGKSVVHTESYIIDLEDLQSYSRYTHTICRISGKSGKENKLLERFRWHLGIA